MLYNVCNVCNCECVISYLFVLLSENYDPTHQHARKLGEQYKLLHVFPMTDMYNIASFNLYYQKHCYTLAIITCSWYVFAGAILHAPTPHMHDYSLSHIKVSSYYATQLYILCIIYIMLPFKFPNTSTKHYHPSQSA